MDSRILRGGRLKQGKYDPRERTLEIEFVNGTLRRFKEVPSEVWRGLLSAPNPATYYEDRIEEEYAYDGSRSSGDDDDARSRLDALFGPPGGGDR